MSRSRANHWDPRGADRPWWVRYWSHVLGGGAGQVTSRRDQSYRLILVCRDMGQVGVPSRDLENLDVLSGLALPASKWAPSLQVMGQEPHHGLRPEQEVKTRPALTLCESEVSVRLGRQQVRAELGVAEE